jgi:hypothetical protein
MSDLAQQSGKVVVPRALFWAWALSTVALLAGNAWGWTAFEKFRQVQKSHDALVEHNRNINGFLGSCAFESKWLRTEMGKLRKGN